MYGHFNRKYDDKPSKLGLQNFQTNPFFMGNLLTFGVASMFQHATAGYETSGAPPQSSAVRAVLCHTPAPGDGILEPMPWQNPNFL
jgi:hypothetical protein